MKRIKRSIIIVAPVIIVLFILARNGYCETTAKIGIAANLPLTGPAAGQCDPYLNGFKMGVRDAAQKYNFSPDVFKIDFQDNQDKPITAVSVFQRQKMNGFDVYISGTSEAAIALAPQIDATGVPNFLLAFDPFLARKGKNFLRIYPNSKIEGPQFVKYANLRKAKRIFIINVNSAYANSEFGDIVEPALKKAGIEYENERFEFAERDFKIIALKAKQYNPDLIFVCGYSIHVYPLLKVLRTAGFNQDGSIMAVMDFVELLHNSTPRQELRGIVFACPLFEVMGAVKGTDDWRTRFKQQFGALPIWAAAYGYDTAGILGKAYHRFHKIDNESIRKSLPYEGITGKINVDKDGDIIATITTAKLAGNDTVVEVK